jgi:hypothetical protein
MIMIECAITMIKISDNHNDQAQALKVDISYDVLLWLDDVILKQL